MIFLTQTRSLFAGALLALSAAFTSGASADEKSGKDHVFWADEVVKGGYILHFRHGHRNRYTITTRTPETDVTAFDAVALNLGLLEENDDFGLVTCLTAEGVAEAKLVSRAFDLLKVQISDVMTSPSCRARQTSYYAFGTEGRIVNSLLHRTSIPEFQWEEVTQNLKDKIIATEIAEGTNVIMSGHVGTLNYNVDLLFAENEVGNMSNRDDIGFVVIEKMADDTLIARHMFPRFRDFSVQLLTIPLN